MLGELETALERAREGQAAAEQSGQPLFAAYNLALESLVHAQLGRVEQATATLPSALVELDAGTSRTSSSSPRAALGHLELALGTPERVRRASRADARLRPS